MYLIQEEREGLSMKSNPIISSIPEDFSNKMTLDRLHLLISGSDSSSRS
jgi:hypothetical protein